MKRTMTFFLLFIKRLCKKPSFVIILLIMPVLIFIFSMILSEGDDTVRVALYNNGNDEMVDIAIEDILNKESAVCFYVSDSVEELRADVLTNTAECGFVFSDGLWEALLKEDAEGLITIYQSTKSSLTDYMKEEVYSAMYTYLASELLENYLDDYDLSEWVSDEERNAYLEEHYRSYLSDGGVFNITYYQGDKEVTTDISEVMNDKSYLKKPIKGTLAIFMMIAALAGAVFWIIDEKDGVYKTLSFRERPYVNLMVTFIPTAMSGAVAFLCLYLGGVSEGFLVELMRVAAYCLMLTGMANLLRIVIKGEALLCSILTMLTVVCLACCNIVINLTLYISGIKVVRYFLAPNYYLETMKSVTGIGITAVIGIILIAIGVLADRKNIKEGA